MPSLKITDWLPLAAGTVLVAIALVPLYWYNYRKRPLTSELSDELYARLQKEWRRLLQEVREIQDHAPVRGSMDEKRQDDLYSIILNYCEPSMADAAHNLAAEERVTLEDLDVVVKQRKPNFFDNDLCDHDGMVAVPPVSRSSILFPSAQAPLTTTSVHDGNSTCISSPAEDHPLAHGRDALAQIMERDDNEMSSMDTKGKDASGRQEMPRRVDPLTRSGDEKQRLGNAKTTQAKKTQCYSRSPAAALTDNSGKENKYSGYKEETDDDKTKKSEKEALMKSAKAAQAEKEKQVLQRLGALWRDRKAQIDRIRSPTPRDIMAICAPDHELAREVALLENDEEFAQKKQELWAHIYS